MTRLATQFGRNLSIDSRLSNHLVTRFRFPKFVCLLSLQRTGVADEKKPNTRNHLVSLPYHPSRIHDGPAFNFEGSQQNLLTSSIRCVFSLKAEQVKPSNHVATASGKKLHCVHQSRISDCLRSLAAGSLTVWWFRTRKSLPLASSRLKATATWNPVSTLARPSFLLLFLFYTFLATF